MKGWWFEGQFRENISLVWWRTSKFRKSIQIIVIFLARIFGRKDASSFLEKWIPIIHQVITHRSTFNWGELIHPILISNRRNLRRNINFTCLHTCWMWCVLAKNILLLVGNESLTFRQFILTARCYGRISIRSIMSLSTMGYLPQFTKSCLVKKHHAFLPKDEGLFKNMEIGRWHQMGSISELQVAPRLHTSFLILYQELCFFMRLLIRHMWMVWLLLFIETRRVFGILFLYQ